MMIDTLYQYAITCCKYICLTRPRRFGKSMTANMIAAFFDESTREESLTLFSKCKVGSLKKKQEEIWTKDLECPEAETLYWPMQGKMKVIRMNMIDYIDDEVTSYADFISVIRDLMKNDLRQMYPKLIIEKNSSIPDLLKETGDSFVFVIDEWDAIFEQSFMTAEDKKKYIISESTVKR